MGDKQRSYAKVLRGAVKGQQNGNVYTHEKPSLVVMTDRKDRDWLCGCLVGEIKSLTMLEGLEAAMKNGGARSYQTQEMGLKVQATSLVMINEIALIKVDDVAFYVTILEENTSRGYPWCQNLRKENQELSSLSLTRVAESIINVAEAPA
ncbi:hypothetical protein Ancab_036458 [Ancistrocladus abbreviatus]